MHWGFRGVWESPMSLEQMYMVFSSDTNILWRQHFMNCWNGFRAVWPPCPDLRHVWFLLPLAKWTLGGSRDIVFIHFVHYQYIFIQDWESGQGPWNSFISSPSSSHPLAFIFYFQIFCQRFTQNQWKILFIILFQLSWFVVIYGDTSFVAASLWNLHVKLCW